MEQNAAIKVYDQKVKGEILSPTVEGINDSNIPEEKYRKACEVRDEYRFRYLHYKQRYEKALEEKEALLKEAADRAVPQTEMWALKAQVESLQDELEGCKSKIEEYKTLFENSCIEKEEIIRKSSEKVEQRALEAQVASLQDELQAYAECRAKLLQQEELYRNVLMENKSLKASSNEFRALELQVASLQDELTRSNHQYAQLTRRYAEKEKQVSDLEGRKCPSCRASYSSSERHRLRNELAEGLVQDRNVLEELKKKQRELEVELECQTKALVLSEEKCLRLERQVEQDEHVIGKLREAVHRLVKENPSLKFVEAEMLKPAFHKIISNEDSKVEEDLVELDKTKEEVDNCVNENSSLKPVQMDVLKGDHPPKKQGFHRIVSKKKDEGKGKRIRRGKNTGEGITAQDHQDIKTSVQHAPPSPLSETGTKERNVRKRGRNQSDKVAELAEEMKILNLTPEKKEKTKRVIRPRRKKVQDENDPTQDNKVLQSESKITRITRSQRKKAVSAVEKDFMSCHKTIKEEPSSLLCLIMGHFCGKTCKVRCNNRMDNYRKLLRKIKTKTGQAAKSVKCYRYADQLNSFDKYFSERETKEKINLLIGDDCESEHDEEHDSSNRAEQRQPWKQHTLQDENSGIRNIGDKCDSVAFPTPRRYGKKRKLQPKPTTSLILMKYIIEQNATHGSTTLNQATEHLQHPVDAFFFGISPMLKSLSPYYLSLAKSEMFATAHKYEMIMLTKQSSYLTPASANNAFQPLQTLQEKASTDRLSSSSCSTTNTNEFNLQNIWQNFL